ncbi:MAG: DUF58 domain-containing protein [Actinomycetaceae bacterium]|nr:DUF58 domain-containing protein [Actinomycetaceae bacterium]MDU0971046.1 DUF58 domain-containing protein [Actinomycetaceae bacterium]
MASPSLLAAARARLTLPVVRRAAKALEGMHPTVGAERGFDFDQIAPYQPGQDVSMIDWAATARAGEPMSRRFLATTAAPLILIADTGREMAAIAPAGSPKSEIVLEAAQILGYLAALRSDPLGLLMGDAGRERYLPPRAGNANAEVVLRALAQQFSPLSPGQNLAGVLGRAEVLVRRPSILVVLTDVPQAGMGVEQLRRLRIRHRVLVLMADDPDPAGLTDRDIVDMEGGVLDPYVLADRRVAEAARHQAMQRRSYALSTLSGLGIPHQRVESPDGVVDALSELLRAG